MRKIHVLLLCIIALMSLCLLTSCKGKKEDEKKKPNPEQEVELPADNLEGDSTEEEDTTKDSASGVQDAGALGEKTEKSKENADTSKKNNTTEGNREDSKPSDNSASEGQGNGTTTPDPDLDQNEKEKKPEEENSERNPIILPTIPLD